jgi:shikimate dehydrogenase
VGFPFFEWREAPKADFAVIGDPISHSLSPKMHMAAFEDLGLPWTFVAVRVARGEVGEALDSLRGRGYRGVNVTVPHKEEAFAWVERTDEFSKRVEAVNTLDLRERESINTDGAGFMGTLSELGVPSGRALVLGAGGSARAMATALFLGGYEVAIFNRTELKAKELVKRVSIEAEVLATPDPAGACLIVNATSAGFTGRSPDLDWSRAEPGALAYDLSYGAEPTPFLARATEAELRTCDGRLLLVAQGALSFEYWLGIPAPREAMLKALR